VKNKGDTFPRHRSVRNGELFKNYNIKEHRSSHNINGCAQTKRNDADRHPQPSIKF